MPPNGTLQWHLTTWRLAMAPSGHVQSANLYPPNGTQQWHLAMASYHMAPSNQQRHHVQSANVCTHPMAPSNGTLPCPPPTCTPTSPLLLEVRTPIAKAIWGTISQRKTLPVECAQGDQPLRCPNQVF